MGLFVTTCYTSFIVISNKYLKAGSNLEPPTFDFSALEQAALSKRKYGSKLMVVVEQMQMAVIWSCKACLLIMYHRLTRTALHNENVAIKILSIYVALGFLIMELLYFAAWCRPFPQYYAVPPKSSQCNTLIDHRITKTVFNISSDLIMLCIALQMLIRSSLPIKRKLVLCGIFSLGLFAVAAAALNSYYSFSHPYEHTWLDWYLRESSMVIIVANIPFTWTILRELFEVGDFDESSRPQPWAFYPPFRTPTTSRLARLSHQTSPAIPSAHTHRSPLDSIGSQDADSLTLVGSGSAARGADGSPAKSLTPKDNERDLEIEQVRSRDFAITPLSIPNRSVGFPSGDAAISPVAETLEKSESLR
ncbi:hypothetical protein N0V90_009474 [Kalmusia sp. IMI 367209]|nr:hypothetical protein N0V90_009474 [Kalmusia sp. IMI 367209]